MSVASTVGGGWGRSFHRNVIGERAFRETGNTGDRSKVDEAHKQTNVRVCFVLKVRSGGRSNVKYILELIGGY